MFSSHNCRRAIRGFLLAVCALLGAACTSATCFAAGYDFATIIDNAGSHDPDFGAWGQRKINDSGEVAFLTSPSFFAYAIYRGNGGSATQIADTASGDSTTAETEPSPTPATLSSEEARQAPQWEFIAATAAPRFPC